MGCSSHVQRRHPPLRQDPPIDPSHRFVPVAPLFVKSAPAMALRAPISKRNDATKPARCSAIPNLPPMGMGDNKRGSGLTKKEVQ